MTLDHIPVLEISIDSNPKLENSIQTLFGINSLKKSCKYPENDGITVITKKIPRIISKGISQVTQSIPITIGIEAKRDPQALLEFVNNIDQPIDSKNRSENHFLKFNWKHPQKYHLEKSNDLDA